MEPQGLGCGVFFASNEGDSLSEEASMEPQGLGCGVFLPKRKTNPVSSSFNGATGFRLWSQVPHQENLRKGQLASMEPQGLGCGVPAQGHIER